MSALGKTRAQRVASAVACVLAMAGATPAYSGNRQAPPAPRAAPRAAGPVMPRGGMTGGGVHMPGGMAGGAHLPGTMANGGVHMPGAMANGGAHMPATMAGGVHVPGATGGGAHMPTSMAGAHVPGSMVSTAHVPGATTGGVHAPGTRLSATHAPAGAAHPPDRTGTQAAAGLRASPQHVGAARDGAHDTRLAGPAAAPHGGGHGGGLADAAAHPGEHGAASVHRAALVRPTGVREDPRLGGKAPLHTHGLETAMAAHREPRPFLHADAHRDVASDRASAASHRDDFHTSDVRGFSTRELAVWRGGVWRNEWHYGRRGWFWDVDGVYYGYDNPVWPYPLVVAALTVYDADVVAGPDLSVAETVSSAGIPPLPPAPPGTYRCGDPAGSFPAVGACGSAWELADNTPPAAPQ